jgi:hypothetical protein
MVVDDTITPVKAFILLTVPLCFRFNLMIGKSTSQDDCQHLYESKDHAVGMSLSGVSPAKDVIWANSVATLTRLTPASVLDRL